MQELKSVKQALSLVSSVQRTLQERPGLWYDVNKLFGGVPLEQDGQDLEVKQLLRAILQQLSCQVFAALLLALAGERQLPSH